MEKLEEKINYSFKSLLGELIQINRSLRLGNSDIVVRDIRRFSIISKVNVDRSFKEIVSLTQPFGIRKDLFNKPENYPTAHLEYKPYIKSIKIYGVKGIKGGAKRTFGYITNMCIKKNTDWINKYKIFFTTSYSTNAINPPEPIEANPNEVCTETFLVIGPFKTKICREACLKYISSSLFKFLLYCGRGTMQVSQDVFRFVPLQDFTANSDIDWNQSIAEIDAQLYRKYNLNNDEIDFIERMIKPMV